MTALKLSNFYIRSSLFGILSLLGAFFNYALYPVLVRVLTAADFGNFTAIMAISNQILGILLAFNVISIYLVKTHDEEKARNHTQSIQKYLIWFFLVAICVTLLISPYLNHLLQIKDIGSFLILGAILLTAIPGVIWVGYLQGHKELVRVGSFNLGAAIGKLVFATILAMVVGANGGLLGILCGTVVGLLALKLMPGVKLPSLRSVLTKTSQEEKDFIFRLKDYLLICLFVVGALSFLQNFDILLAKALFSPSIAGMYSGISILSNALYYVCFLLIWIILPEIDINDRLSSRRILSTGYKLLAIITAGALVVEYLFRNLLTKLLLGPGFGGQGTVLIFATLYQLTLVAVTLYAYYLLVHRERRGLYLSLSVFVICVIVPTVFADTPLLMIQLLWLSLLAGCSVFLAASRLRLQIQQSS